MEQKRFLTADEVFQMFGVDADALEELVNKGAVSPLADRGSFKYRSEDFAALVKEGTLTPRTSGEMFLVDSSDDIPFLNEGGRVDDEVSFIELDEDALNEQANPDYAASSPSDSSLDELPSTFEFKLQEPQSEPHQIAQGDSLSGSDSDVRIVGFPSEINKPDQATSSDVIAYSPIPERARMTDSDSDVRLSPPSGTDDESSAAHVSSQSDSDVRFAFSKSEEPIAATTDSDSDVKIVEVNQAAARIDEESGITLESADSGISLVGEDSGIRLGDSDSGISLEGHDSGIRLSDEDSGIRLDSGDSGISLNSGDSGISLDSGDSGISLDSGDSGISLGGADSGIRLDDSDSGISLGGDSGITLEGDVYDPAANSGIDAPAGKKQKPPAPKAPIKEPVKKGTDVTQTLDLSDELSLDSGFDVSLVEDPTTELNFRDRKEETPGFPATVVTKGGQKSAVPPTAPTLSETFQLDEPPEVEDLDISDDLEDAAGSEEFVAIEDEEVFEASDDDFGVNDELSVDDDVLSDDEVVVPAAKAKKGPREPQWGMLAIAPIACASLLMLATVGILWAGVATMWTGAEAPGPAASLISTLAGLF